jgi:hypothetical protein
VEKKEKGRMDYRERSATVLRMTENNLKKTYQKDDIDEIIEENKRATDVRVYLVSKRSYESRYGPWRGKRINKDTVLHMDHIIEKKKKIKAIHYQKRKKKKEKKKN